MRRNRTRTLPLAVAAATAAGLVLSLLPAPAGAASVARPRPERPEAPVLDADQPALPRDVRVERYGELRFVIDPAVQPRRPQARPLDGTRDPRPVGAVALPEGGTSELVLDEVQLHVDDPGELDAFLDRWDGEVLQSDPADEEGQDLLVRVDPTGADVDALAANLLAIEPEHVGEHRVSSTRTLELLALLAEESADDVEVAPNVLGESHAVEDGVVTEGATAPGNAFGWSYLRGGGPQDTGVAPAWQLLEDAGKLGNDVRLMVQDGGFVQSQDWPFASTVRKTSWGAVNPWDCGGSTCPNHGSNVVEAMQAQADNGFGSAGPAGVLDRSVVAVGVSDGIWETYRDLQHMAQEHQPDVVNTSYSTTFWGFKAASEAAANRRFKKINATGALMVASAGNQGVTVDSDDLILPCESWRVLCVGGTANGATTRHPSSNFGLGDSSTSVELYGPYCVHGLAAPATPATSAITNAGTCGTSFSSPFVAGVAALLKAADPSLTQSQIRSLLNGTAHVGGLGPEVTGSQRRVDALAAVASVLKVKVTAPKVTIQSPKHKSQHAPEADVELAATAIDYRGKHLPITWTSDRDGQVGTTMTGPQFVTLSTGTHVLTASATDPDARTSTAKVTVSVVDSPATVTILSPAKGAKLTAGSPVQLTGTSYDPDTYGPADDDEVTWVVERNGVEVLEEDGHQVVLPAAKALAGSYEVTFRADGGTAATRTFQLVAAPPGTTPPTATIESPEDGTIRTTTGFDPVPFTFEGSGADADDGPVPGTRYRWVAHSAKKSIVLCTGSSVPGQGGGGKLGQTKDCSSFEAALPAQQGPTNDTVWTVQLEVFDGDGLSAVDSVQVTVRFLVG